jgi:hypothetical protein
MYTFNKIFCYSFSGQKDPQVFIHTCGSVELKLKSSVLRYFFSIAPVSGKQPPQLCKAAVICGIQAISHIFACRRKKYQFTRL